MNKVIISRVVSNQDPFHQGRIQVSGIGHWIAPINRYSTIKAEDIPRTGLIVRLTRTKEDPKHFYYIT